MRLSLRLILFLVVGITLVTFLIARAQVRAEKLGLRSDLERRAEVLGESLREIVEPALGSHDQLARVVERFDNRENLAGVVVYDRDDKVLAESSNLMSKLLPPPPPLDHPGADGGVGRLVNIGGVPMHAYYLPLHQNGADAGILAIFHDATYIESQSERIWRETIWHVIAQVLLIVLVTALIIRWTVVLPISRTAQWMKDLRDGRVSPRPNLPKEDFLAPFSQEVVKFAHSLSEARAAAEEEARLRETGESLWTPERLRVSVQNKVRGSLFVVSNREPYMHVHRGKNIEVFVPASGLVTALEPILRACGGTWIAHGSGDADRQTVDKNDRLRVPPDKPEYTLRRVWLTKEEEDGYYYGFANEGLWPLCHIAHTRPTFRTVRLAELSIRQPQIRRRPSGGNGRRRKRAGARPGLPFRSSAAHDQGCASRRAHRHLLAYSVAQPGSVRHLPVATGASRRLTGCGSGRFPYPGALQQFPRNRRYCTRVAHRMGAICREARRPRHVGAPVPN